MSYLGAGFVLLAVFSGGAAGGSCPAATAPAASATAPAASASATAVAPAAESVSPVLTQQASGIWTTTIYLSTAALCPASPSFELVTTSPDHAVPGQAAYHPAVNCGALAPAAPAPLTAVHLTFGPCNELASPPVTAAVVVTPAVATAAPVQITVTVHRRVSSYQYLWIPFGSGAGLAALFVLTMLIGKLPDPNADPPDPTAGQQPGRDDRPAKMHVRQFWSRPLYAAAAWTFSGSWATNITAAVAVVATLLTAGGTVSELLPGVEIGRFSLLIAMAGGVTLVAPLVFGALNYRFERLDPTTAGVSVISLPRGPVAVLSSWAWKTGPDQLKRRYRAGALVVTVEDPETLLPLGHDGKPRPDALARLTARKKFPVRPGAKVLLPGGTEFKVPGTYKARLPDRDAWRQEAIIAVPAGATITVSGGADIPAAGPAAAGQQPPAGQQTPAFMELPGQNGASLKPGATLSVPPGATITLSSSLLEAASPLLALPGTSDITVFAGQQVAISAKATLAAGDVAVTRPAGAAAATPCGYRLHEDHALTMPAGAKITFLGRASLKLPAGTLVAAPGTGSRLSARGWSLKATTVYPLPHTGQVVASQMWTLIIASCLTLFGAGAELGILGVLTLSLSSADIAVRVLCAIGAAATAVVVLAYSVVAIRALADPIPGDALNATGGTAFML
jgi:hypothetical protein